MRPAGDVGGNVDSPQRGRPHAGWAPVLLAVVAVATTFALALVDHVTISRRSGLGQVGFGIPFAWLTQDQSALDQPFPLDASFDSPWEHPTSVAVVPLVLDALVLH